MRHFEVGQIVWCLLGWQWFEGQIISIHGTLATVQWVGFGGTCPYDMRNKDIRTAEEHVKQLLVQ